MVLASLHADVKVLLLLLLQQSLTFAASRSLLFLEQQLIPLLTLARLLLLALSPILLLALPHRNHPCLWNRPTSRVLTGAASR